MACVLKTDYIVAESEIKLTVIIGDAQLGASYVALAGKKVDIGQISDKKIGKGKELKGKTLSVKTIVSDVRKETNHTSVTYQLIGGAKDCQYSLEATVVHEGDAINYETEFTFI